jgi:hypothetical protein
MGERQIAPYHHKPEILPFYHHPQYRTQLPEKAKGP